ncbi:hypothetical protein P8C59_007650 [Phyllachora maydis]|uniref:Mitochondrial zinc maintenance protein 1, mitochondrial n=1 Tax=Phyllachora maydis TaxID=1825666 RepID=A0AAD9I957_9PEZI|nr:hypothetical protein P8C59_007650 [Phyllachora maydis]
MALAAYRHLLRAVSICFQGDVAVLAAARSQIRSSFRDNATLPSEAVPPAVRHAEEVATMLKANVVQGRREGDTYKLRIHEHTERGDNDTIKLGGKTVKVDGKTCRDG